MKIFPLLGERQKKGLELLGITSEEEVQGNSHLYYFVRKVVMRSLYRQLRAKGMAMNEILSFMSNYFSLSIDRVRDIVFR